MSLCCWLGNNVKNVPIVFSLYCTACQHPAQKASFQRHGQPAPTNIWEGFRTIRSYCPEPFWTIRCYCPEPLRTITSSYFYGDSIWFKMDWSHEWKTGKVLGQDVKVLFIKYGNFIRRVPLDQLFQLMKNMKNIQEKEHVDHAWMVMVGRSFNFL